MPATRSGDSMRDTVFTPNDVLVMYRNITGIICSSTHDSGSSIIITALGEALDDEYRDDDTPPKLLRHVFASLMKQERISGSKRSHKTV
jgi:hypothetical protein